MFYTSDEKELLRGSPMFEHITNEIKEITEEYNSIVSAVPQFKKFTLDEYIKNKNLGY